MLKHVAVVHFRCFIVSYCGTSSYYLYFLLTVAIMFFFSSFLFAVKIMLVKLSMDFF